MRLPNGRIQCDAETGRPGHWGSCKRTAEYISQRGHSILHFCEHHLGRASDEASCSQPRDTRRLTDADRYDMVRAVLGKPQFSRKHRAA